MWAEFVHRVPVRCGFLLAVCTVLLPGAGCVRERGDPAHPLSVTLFAAASTTDAVLEAVLMFERETGFEVRENFASSATLAQQIRAGANADLFLSASAEWVEFLSREGRIAESRAFLENRLVVITPLGSHVTIHLLSDLLSPEVARLSLADYESVPAGIYARRALERSGLWQGVRSRVVQGSDVRQALLFVERGEADAGIVYQTDAMVSDNVSIALPIEREWSGDIVYPLALVARAEPRAEVRRFYDFLHSSASAQIFRRYGFEVREGSVPSSVPELIHQKTKGSVPSSNSSNKEAGEGSVPNSIRPGGK